MGLKSVSAADPIWVANFVRGIPVSSGTSDGNGVLVTTSAFDMKEGNVVALMLTAVGLTDDINFTGMNATFAGQPMNVVTVNQTAQSSTIFYLINPTNTVGSFKVTTGSGVTGSFAYSQIALVNVVGVAGTATARSTSTATGTPLLLSYTTTNNGGFVLGAAVNADYNGARPLSVAPGSNPDTVLFGFANVANSGDLHVYGDIVAAGSYTDGYLGQYTRTAIATVAFNAATTNTIPAPNSVAIWPLGDSITYGAGYAGGYRESLYTNLAARGYAVRLVGSSTGNSTTLLADALQTHHDGHSGYSITNAVNIDDGSSRPGIYEDVEFWHNSIATPDVILLMIGINDLNTGYQVDTAAARLNLLINRLFGYYPNTRILVASLPDAKQVNSFRHGAVNDIAAAVSNYNAGMLSVVATHRAAGQKIERVDMHSKFTLADLADGLHPNTNGYIKMGNIWADAVAEAPAVNATRVRVFLLGGQSNADGRASTTGQPSYPDIDFYYNTAFSAEGVIEKLTTLYPGASRWHGLGPELSFGRRLADVLGCDTNNTRLAVIKHAEGATSLYSNWKADGNATTNGDGDQYLIFQQTVANGMAALTNKYPNAQIGIEGMVWMQGETDADIGKGAAYAGNLNRFITDVRATIRTNLPFVIGRLSNNQSNWFVRVDGGATQLGLLQASQDAVAAGDPRVGIFNTDDLDVNPPNDDIHFNTASQLELGKRFAYETAYLLWVTGQLTPTQINAGMGKKDQDPDGDGVVNESEFNAGTDVSSAGSKLQAGLALTGNGTLKLSYPSSTYRYYQISMCTNLTENNWTDVTAAMRGSGVTVTNWFTNSANQAFYKIKASVP